MLNKNNSLEALLNSWKEVRPPLHRILFVKTKRFLYQKRVNKEYLNGDVFRSFADLSIDHKDDLSTCANWKNLKNARVIFCNSSLLQDFLDSYGEVLSCEVIIAGNSDQDFYEMPVNLPSSIKHIFLQNSFIPNSKLITCIPIGVENARYAVNGSSRLMKRNFDWAKRPNYLLFGPYGLTHPDRKKIVSNLFGHKEFDFLYGRLSPRQYSKISSHYKFVACLRGNGVDTHRFWETIYRGGIPLVENSIWANNMRSLSIPMAITSSWSVEDVNNSLTDYHFSDQDLRTIPALWPSYWQERIQFK